MSDVLLQLLGEQLHPRSIRKVSPRHGGEYHSPCPICGGDDRFIVFPEQDGGELCQKFGVTGTWACPRHCQTGGDAIAFLTVLCGMSFADACDHLGIKLERQNASSHGYRPLRRPELHTQSLNFVPHSYVAPSAKWREQATKMASEAHNTLLQTPTMLAWLAQRGIPERACKVFGLGYIEGEGRDGTCIFRQRVAFGLPPKTRPDGSHVRALRIPRGITIPVWRAGECWRIRIRRRNADLDLQNKRDAKYILVPQPDNAFSAPLVITPQDIAATAATWVVVEAELDAMAVYHACGGRVGVISVLTVSGKPDSDAHSLLQQAARILVALDVDQAKADGSTPTADAWPWWQQTYPQAKLWPVPDGKDPGEAFARGVDLAAWIFAGLPVPILASNTIEKSSTPAQNGIPGISLECLPLQDEEVSRLPAYLTWADVPQDVQHLLAAWRNKPVRFIWLRGADGARNGFAWDYDQAWARKNWEALQALQQFSDAKACCNWLAAHQGDIIAAKNLLNLWG